MMIHDLKIYMSIWMVQKIYDDMVVTWLILQII